MKQPMTTTLPSPFIIPTRAPTQTTEFFVPFTSRTTFRTTTTSTTTTSTTQRIFTTTGSIRKDNGESLFDDPLTVFDLYLFRLFNLSKMVVNFFYALDTNRGRQA